MTGPSISSFIRKISQVSIRNIWVELLKTFGLFTLQGKLPFSKEVSLDIALELNYRQQGKKKLSARFQIH